MPQTPTTTSTPYCTAADLFVFHDPAQVADMLTSGNEPRPSVAAMLDSSQGVGLMLYKFLLSAAGRIESTCLVAARYSPADLRTLVDTGASGAQMLIKLNADVAFWQLCQRKQPNASDPKNVPGAAEAYEFLKQLSEGATIFGFVESAAAGLPSVVTPNPAMLVTPNAVARAYRLFPTYQLGQRYGGG